MDRAEGTGLSIAVLGHAALFALVSASLTRPPELPKLDNPPVEVTLTSEVAIRDSAPAPAQVQPTPVVAPQPEPMPAPPVEAAPPPPPLPRPQPRTEAPPQPAKPRPAPAAPAKALPKPAPKAQPRATKPAQPDPEGRRRPGLSSSIVAGLSDSSTPAANVKPSVKAAPPATATPSTIPVSQMTGAQKASLNSLIFTQLKPHWRPPSGADAELLVTQLSVRLNQDGSLAADPEVIIQRGINDSNRAQARLHAERAIQAVRRAAPFSLPPQFYEGWKWLNPLTFDGRLSR